MKIKIPNYTFNKTAKTVTFSGYATIKLDGIQLITNVTRNIIIYNFANPALGGTVATNVLTLAYDTSEMANTDKLMIIYEDDAQSLYDRLVLINTAVTNVYNKVVEQLSSLTGWWATATGWYNEVVQARDTARNLTDTKGIPALDKINGGDLVSSQFYVYTNDYVVSYSDLSTIQVGYGGYWKKGDIVFFTGIQEYGKVKSVDYMSNYIFLEAPLSQYPGSYETLTVYRRIMPAFNGSGQQEVVLAGSGGPSSDVTIIKNRQDSFTSGQLYFSYTGNYTDFYGIDAFNEITLILDDPTGWASAGCGIYFYGSMDGVNFDVGCNVRDKYDSDYYSTSRPGGYTVDTKGFQAIRAQVGWYSGSGHYTNITVKGRPIGKHVQKVEMLGSLSGTFGVYPSSTFDIGNKTGTIFSSTANLGANAAYTVTPNLASYSHLDLHIFTSHISAIEGLKIEHSESSSGPWKSFPAPQTILPMTTGQPWFVSIPVMFSYIKITYTNGPVATTTFRIEGRGRSISSVKTAVDTYQNQFVRGAFLPTYSACTDLFTPDGTATTDVWDFYGVANREIQIQKIIISGHATAQTVSHAWSLSKRSTAPTGGTSTAPTKVPLSTVFAASTATIRSYTLKPTALGTILGNIFKKGVNIPAVGTGTLDPIIELDFTQGLNMQPITLNAANEGIALNLGGVAIPGLQLQVTVFYTESAYL